MEQYKQIFVWKCVACGRILTTSGGMERHLKKCKYIPEQMEGQVGIAELLNRLEMKKAHP